MTKSQKSTSVADIILQKRLVIRRPKKEEMGTPGKIIWVDPTTLHIDHESYQRDTNEKHAMKIGENYRYDRAKVISGFRCTKSGTIYVTDGQHSSVGAAIAGVPEVPVYVFDLPEGASLRDLVKLQSAQFVAINKSVKRIQKYDEYRNDLLQEAPYALGIDALCKKHNVTLIPANKAKGAGTLSHMVSIINSYTQIGESGVDLALGFIRSSWPYDHVEGPVLMSLARFLKKFAEAESRKLPKTTINRTILKQALTYNGTHSQKAIEGYLTERALDFKISAYGEMSTWRAKVIRHLYNEYVTENNLGEDKLLNTKVMG